MGGQVGGRRFRLLALSGVLLLVACAPSPGEQTGRSGVTSVEVERSEPLGSFGGVPFERLSGRVEGQVHRSEPVVGLGQLLGDREFHRYRSEFEVIRPVAAAPRRVAVVEVENRGSPLMLQLFNRFVIGFSGAPSQTTYPPRIGDGFLFVGGRTYARVQWQTVISPGVPDSAQGVGEVIVRDFGRLLRSGRLRESASPLGRYPTLLLTGISQSGWFIDTFVAEGFNADPAGGRVYDGAFPLASAGNWLAINRLGDDGQAQQPYVRPNGRPLPASRILTRPATDPFFVDVPTYTDFYRLRAALSRDGKAPGRSRRYEWPAAHLPAFFVDDAFVFQTLRCNDGKVVPRNPLDVRPYVRAVLAGLEGELDRGDRRLAPAVLFRLGREPQPSPYFNGLPGADVPVPVVDDDAQPQGGVRFPEVDLPLGRLEPVSLPPVETSGITAICGNVGGYQPFTRAELEQRYGSVDEYLRRVRPLVDRLVRRGHVLSSDRELVLGELRRRFEAAPGG